MTVAYLCSYCLADLFTLDSYFYVEVLCLIELYVHPSHICNPSCSYKHVVGPKVQQEGNSILTWFLLLNSITFY